ncbi:hypothetical protein GCM10010472_47930 [Pseudonocardia halophobica]|uniref:Aquaporin n=1 Tax=Pseudonocardia halophobica TaxID=29401 RepID=A0A9W6L5T6_9PSEU|nr:aquaporin [Pseudonocardia halophobica]GLL13608.1 hypothetical protein GCM10017577_47520 [Pseudonocardia halophobica]
MTQAASGVQPENPSRAVTGGSVDPARTLGPAIVAGEFSAPWAYLLGPIVGGGLAALLYHRFLAKGDKPA